MKSTTSSNLQPQLQSSFTYRDVVYDIDWYDLGHELPSLPWSQVYVIGDVEGKSPIVHYDTGDKNNLPGGSFEPGETVEEALKREIKEEINYDVISWTPIGYQKIRNPETYQLRVCAKLKKIDDFTNDPGGHVIGHSLVPIDELNSYIRYGEIGDRMVKIAKSRLKRS